MASFVTVSDQWASASDDGMAAVFGVFTDTGDRDVHIVAADSPAAAAVELHEVVHDAAGPAMMQPKSGGFTVPAGGRHELAPGGDHLMLMQLRQPLQPGTDVGVTVRFADGSSLPITAQVRDFPGGQEPYRPDMHSSG
ncbi:copper chaperone PCu(A)C [Mycolicibacterium sp. 3033]|nr:copper chaperone PCu(A)C [Mycolicibacterium aurantiacum]